MENFIKGRGVLPDPQTNLTEKTRLFYGKWGGSHSIHKKLYKKVKENPYWEEGRGGQENVEFFHISSVFNFWPLPLA